MFLLRRQNLSFRAFTVVELLLVLFILGIIAGVSLPAFSNYFQSIVLDQKKNDVIHLMRFAQSRAIIDKKIYYILIESSLGRLQLMTDDNQQNELRLYSGKGGREIVMEEVQISSTKDKVAFYPNGLIDPVTLRFSYQNKHSVITTEKQRGYIRDIEE